jgi:hypothetical protein
MLLGMNSKQLNPVPPIFTALGGTLEKHTSRGAYEERDSATVSFTNHILEAFLKCKI